MKKIFLISIIVLAGCGMLRRSSSSTDTSLHTENTQLTEQQNSTIETSATSAAWYNMLDSSNTGYSYQFYPKGSFRISPDGSMKGEFDNITMHGRQVRSSKLKGLTLADEKVAKASSAGKKQTSKIRSEQKTLKKFSTPDGKWLIIALTLTVCIIIWIKMPGNTGSKVPMS
jgi:Tfp pilus assembly protein PilV